MSLGRIWSKGQKGFFQLITENNDTPKQVTDIIKGVTNIVMKVQAVLNDMEGKYKKIWDTDKVAYMRRYRRNLESRNFDADIKVYLDHIDEIRAEESTINLEFLHIDQQPIKAVRVSPPFATLLQPTKETVLDQCSESFLFAGVGVALRAVGYEVHAAAA